MSDRLATEDAPAGFADLLAQVADSARCGATLRAQADEVLTLGGRVTRELGRASLTTWQDIVLDEVGDSCRAEYEPPAHGPEPALILGIHAFGRIALGAGPGRDGLMVGQFALRPEAASRIAARLAACRDEQTPWEHEVKQYFAETSADQARAMLGSVAQATDRTDPILVYVDDVSYSNTPTFNNLLHRGTGGAKGMLFDELVKLAPRDWAWTAQQLVYCLYQLRAAGFRGEEFNGRQLTAVALHAWFDDMAARCAAAAGEVPPARSERLAVKAQKLRALRERLASSHTFYRVINGLTLNKEQRFYSRSELCPIDPPRLAPGIHARFLRDGVDPAQHTRVYDVCSAWLGQVLGQAHDGTGLHPVEDMLCTFVRAAVEELRSDIGMTRCLRDFAELVRVVDGDLAEEANGWSRSEYFCAVVASEHTRERMRDQRTELADVLKAISARMRYNGWHYMPGHFDPARRTAERHMYMPPAMSDIASWSDQHHRGHVVARVRYCIRAPGPLMLRNKLMTGFYDLRVMRNEGVEYTVAEMRRCDEYKAQLGALYQALLDHVIAGARFRVEAFTNQWYEETA